MHLFDYSFLGKTVTARVANMAANIGSLRAMADVRKSEHLAVFTALEQVARVESVKGSNAIEGIVTSEERVRALAAGKTAPLNHDEAEIAGYRDALAEIHQDYYRLQFGEGVILHLHEVMLSLCGYEFAGQYKTFDNCIMEIDREGKRSVRFIPTSAAQTREAMEQLILAYMEARNDPNINPLLLIPCVVLDFLCIHPFRDGNGRVSRLLLLLLLYQEGYDIGKYVSYEAQINRYKNLYYDALRVSSDGWHESQNDYFPFIENFLSLLYMCYKELDGRFATVNGRRVGKAERVEATVLNSLTPVSKAEICAFLPDVSPTMVEAVLGKLVKSGRIQKFGAARSVKYFRNQIDR